MIKIFKMAFVNSNWDKVTADAWQKNFCPPWRPSARDMKNYKEGLRNIGSLKNILILGATPELRCLAAETGAAVWVMDRSKNMISEMAKLIRTGNSGTEKQFSADWLRLENIFKKQSFDAVLGDLVLRIISLKDWGGFLRSVLSLLKPDGIFITRVHFLDGSLKNLSAEEIINKTFSVLGSASFEKEIRNLLVSRLLDKYFFLGSRDKIENRIIKEIKNYFVCHPEIELVQKNILRGVLRRVERMAEFSSQTKEKIEKELRRFFLIKKQLVADDYDDSDFYPVYILQS